MINWITITICVELAALGYRPAHLRQLIPTSLSLFERRVWDVRMEGELAIGVLSSKPWSMSFSHSLGSQLWCCRVVWLLIYIYVLVWTTTSKLTTSFINIGCVLILSFFFFMLSALSILLSCYEFFLSPLKVVHLRLISLLLLTLIIDKTGIYVVISTNITHRWLLAGVSPNTRCLLLPRLLWFKFILLVKLEAKLRAFLSMFLLAFLEISLLVPYISHRWANQRCCVWDIGWLVVGNYGVVRCRWPTPAQTFILTVDVLKGNFGRFCLI